MVSWYLSEKILRLADARGRNAREFGGRRRSTIREMELPRRVRRPSAPALGCPDHSRKFHMRPRVSGQAHLRSVHHRLYQAVLVVLTSGMEGRCRVTPPTAQIDVLLALAVLLPFLPEALRLSPRVYHLSIPTLRLRWSMSRCHRRPPGLFLLPRPSREVNGSRLSLCAQ